jgi:hypothetical protein
VFFVFCFVFLSPLVWFFLWLPEEVLALLFLLHRENRDFSILMKDIDISHSRFKQIKVNLVCFDQVICTIFCNAGFLFPQTRTYLICEGTR